MAEQTYTLKRMPERTWTWLKVNTLDSAFLTAEGDKKDPGVSIQLPAGVAFEEGSREIHWPADPADFFAGEDLQQTLQENTNAVFSLRIPEGIQVKDPVVITMDGGDSGFLGDYLQIEAEKNASCTILLHYKEGGQLNHHQGLTKVMVHSGAKVKLIKTQLFDKGIDHKDYVAAYVEDGGDFSLLQPEIGAGTITTAWNIILGGKESNADVDILYVGEGEKKLDFTIRILLQGKNTTANIRAKGILSGSSRKIFRDTLDFVTGSAGAKGREEESVLMLSPKVRNISVPLLFCTEADVEGEHAASSGRPDEGVLLYLMSRGLSETEARMLLAEATFTTLLEGLFDEDLKEKILAGVKKSIEGGTAS